MSWSKARLWLLPALQDGTEDELLQDLRAGDARLWLGEGAALVTQPLGEVLHVWLGGGDLGGILAMRSGIEAFARGCGCREITITGRRGWERVLRPHGFSMRDGELRKAL